MSQSESPPLHRTKRHTDLSSGSALWVSKNLHDLTELPAPGTDWKGHETDFDSPMLTKLQIEGVIEKPESQDRVSGGAYSYRTTEEGYEAVQTFLEDWDNSDRLLPCDDESCPGKGFVTTSEGLECKECGQVHDKEDVR